MTTVDLTPEKGIELLEEGQRELMRLVGAVSKEALDEPDAIGHWSIKDLIGVVRGVSIRLEGRLGKLPAGD